MKNIWPIKKLSEVCKIYQPKTITSKEIKKFGSFKVFGANGVIGFYDKYNHEESEIAVTCRGATCGTINWTEPKSWITGNAMVVTPTSDELNKEFLYYQLLGLDIGSTISGSAQPQITRQALSPFEVKVPSLTIQQKIVERLDAIRKAQELNDLQISRTQELFESISNKYFINSEPNVKLGEVISLEYGKGLPGRERSGNGFPVFGSNGLVGHHKEFLIIGPGIVVGRKGSIGEIVWVNDNFWPIDTTYYVNLKRNDNLEYIYFLLKTLDLKSLNKAGAVPGLNRNDAYAKKITLHKFSEQQKIVEKLNAVQDYKKSLQKQKDLFHELFASVLNKSINGELDG